MNLKGMMLSESNQTRKCLRSVVARDERVL